MSQAVVTPLAIDDTPKETPAMTPGLLVNRPDLSDEAVIRAIADHGDAVGVSVRDPAALLQAALDGDADARGLLSGLVLPPPAAPLPMHPQRLRRDAGRARDRADARWRLMPFAWARRGQA